MPQFANHTNFANGCLGGRLNKNINPQKEITHRMSITMPILQQLHIFWKIFNNKKEANCVGAIHANAEKFDVRTEELFKYLQIFTAVCDSFSHGANDVANAIGPFAVIWAIFQAGKLDKKTDMGTDAYWILALGGVGIALGLLVYGYKITQAIGNKLCKITPSRGKLHLPRLPIIGHR